MANYSTHDLKLTDAISNIEKGLTRLPDFQRSYVWRENNRKSLIDSMQKGYPVGGLLLLELEPGSGSASPFGEKYFEFSQHDPAAGTAMPAKWLVLDGQQRLTSSFMAFSMATTAKKVFFVDLKKLHEKTGGQPRQEINFEDFLVLKPRPTHLQQHLFDLDLLPLPFISLGRQGLREKLHDYVTNLQAKPEQQNFATFINVALEGYLDNIFDYQFPCVVLPRTLDLEAVSNVFTKLNTSGVALSAFDLCVSNLFPKGENLRERWDKAKDEVAVTLLDRDGTALLQTVALLDGKPVKKSGLVKNITQTSVRAYWAESVSTFVSLKKNLEIGGFASKKTLPYDTLAPALAAATIKAPCGTQPPEKQARQVKIERWILQTAFSQRYTEGSDAKKQDDFPKAVEWFKNGTTPDFLEAVPWTDSIKYFPNTGARFNAFLAILNKREPHDFVQHGHRLGIETQAHNAQIHHIFPRAWLAANVPGIDNKGINRALNMTFLTAESNNFISDDAPSVYLNRLFTYLKESLSELRDEEIWAKLKDLMSEHLIEAAAFQAMLDNDYEAFLTARAETLKNYLVSQGVTVAVVQQQDADDEAEIGSDEN